MERSGTLGSGGDYLCVLKGREQWRSAVAKVKLQKLLMLLMASTDLDLLLSFQDATINSLSTQGSAALHPGLYAWAAPRHGVLQEALKHIEHFH